MLFFSLTSYLFDDSIKSKGDCYMALTYEEFKKIVPKETSEFVDLFLPYWDYYVRYGNIISLSGIEVYSEKSKEFVSMLNALSQMTEYGVFLGKCGYIKFYLEFKMHLVSKNEIIFDQCNYLFDFLIDDVNFRCLYPLDIVKHLLQEYSFDKDIYKSLFRGMKGKEFTGQIEKYQEEKDRETEHH